MKLLFLLTELPYPSFNGVRIKTFNVIKGLHERGHEVHVISFIRESDKLNADVVCELRKYCASLHVIPLNNTYGRLISNIISSLGNKDIITFRFKSSAFNAELMKVIKLNSFDVIHFDLIPLTHYAQSVCGDVPLVASINDSYSLWLKNKLLRYPNLNMSSLADKAYYTVTFPLATNYEKQIYSSFQKIQVVSDNDKRYLKELNETLDVQVIPNGVDTAYFKPLGLPLQENSLCFVASMTHENVENASWFIRKVFLEVKKEIPNATLYLVGRDPQATLLNEARRIKGVIVTGFVEDVRPFIDSASVVIDPTAKTCGILNHVLQSMAMGKAVVGMSSSFLAIKGAASPKNMVIAKNRRDFVSNLIYLMKHPSETKRIGLNARRLMEMEYTWPLIISKYEKMYSQAIEKFNAGTCHSQFN